MLVCLGCIQEGDDSIRVVCASSDWCSRCGAAPEPFLPMPVGIPASFNLHHLFRVHVVESTLDLGRPPPP